MQTAGAAQVSKLAFISLAQYTYPYGGKCLCLSGGGNGVEALLRHDVLYESIAGFLVFKDMSHTLALRADRFAACLGRRMNSRYNGNLSESSVEKPRNVL